MVLVAVETFGTAGFAAVHSTDPLEEEAVAVLPPLRTLVDTAVVVPADAITPTNSVSTGHVVHQAVPGHQDTVHNDVGSCSDQHCIPQSPYRFPRRMDWAPRV